MPTAVLTAKTETLCSPTVPLKAGKPSQANKTTTGATLRSLYNRAARAFLHRDVPQTHSLLTSAFAIIQPPSSYVSDSLATQRRKWDILRITLETTIYTSPSDEDVIPPSLHDSLTLSSQFLINMMHQRSLVLFTPTAHSQPTSAFLPSKVLITLVLSSMKLDCSEVGRFMIEDWLARRGQFDDSLEDGEGYEKVLDIYSLHVLPRLEQWDYAREFLQYENQLPLERRKRLGSLLQTLYTDTMEARHAPSPLRIPTPANSIPSSSRSASPTPSASSSSTASTHTAIPRTPRQNAPVPQAMSGLIPSSSSSSSLLSNVTVSKRNLSHPNPHPATTSNPASANGSTSVSTAVSSSRAFHPQQLQSPSATPRVPSTLAVIRASLSPYLTSSRLTTFLLLFVLLPLTSLVLMVRRQRRGIGTGSGIGAADVVRRRLANGQRQTIIGRIWAEIVKAVSDTVRMGGGGLV